MIVKKGITKGNIYASLVDFDTCFLNRIYGVKTEDIDSLKILLLISTLLMQSIFNLIFLLAWGLKYDDILDNELYSLPNIFDF